MQYPTEKPNHESLSIENLYPVTDWKQTPLSTENQIKTSYPVNQSPVSKEKTEPCIQWKINVKQDPLKPTIRN